MSAPVARILVAVRRLDEATSLGRILDVLTDAAASEGVRVAVMLVDGDDLTLYRAAGLDGSDVPPRMAIASSAAAEQAVATRQVVALGREVEGSTAVFRVGSGRLGQLFPLVVDQSAVALVFVNGPADMLDWGDIVEVLVRHGSARLESVTSQRTVEALTAPY